MTFEQKLEIFQSFLELSMYEYEFIIFLKTKIYMIELELTIVNSNTEIMQFVEEMYQYFSENKLKKYN